VFGCLFGGGAVVSWHLMPRFFQFFAL
jgi:hypothetical protein